MPYVCGKMPKKCSLIIEPLLLVIRDQSIKVVLYKWKFFDEKMYVNGSGGSFDV